MKRIGIYSGTFDPVHKGHIAFALGAIGTCGLDEVLFLPERTPRGKAGASDYTHREVLLQNMLAPFPALRMVHLEEERFDIANTLPNLKQICGDAELTFLLGSDLVFTLRDWDNLEILLSEAAFAIGMRDSDTKEAVMAQLQQIESAYGRSLRFIIVETEYAGLSSSKIRLRHDDYCKV